MRPIAFALGLAALVAACSSGERAPARADSAAAAKPQVVDSILPIEEHLRRFRKGLPEVAALEGGAASDTALVRDFLAAVAARDSSALSRLVLSRAEFAWLYYPAHLYARPPYELDPGTSWTLMQGNSAKGFVRILRDYGGKELRYVTHGCAPAGTVQAPVEEWNACEVAVRVDGALVTKRMFGSIVRLDGRYKFVSYANDL
ncbi:MAG TPA: hypothetical protein VFX50_02915 [Gemmatimonadales bacterium]|nr:hypothetical protein [Gemmatimonadales bacterium]